MDRAFRRAILLSDILARALLRGDSYLSRAGFDLVTGTTACELLDLATRRPPAAAIVGYDLADLPGHEVCRRLKGLEPPPPVLVVGPSRPPEAEKLSREAGCDEYVIVPMKPHVLLTRLAARLDARFRLHARRPIVLPVSCGRLIREFLGHTRDLSESGAQIETVLRPGVGRRLLLRLYTDDGGTLVLPALVLRARGSREKDQNLLGVQFLPATAAQRARLKDLLGGRI